MKHSQLTDQLQEQASLYASGAMTGSERQEYARHLEDDRCTVCGQEVEELQAAMAMLAFTAAPAEPSATVRDRLMEQARSASVRAVAAPASMPSLRRHWLEVILGAAAVGAIVVALAATRANTEMQQLTNALRARVAQLEVQLARTNDYVATLTSPDVQVVNLAGQGTNIQASGRIFVDPKQKRWHMYVKDLPQAPKDKAYELWFVPKTGNPVRAVVFNTMPAGSTQIDIDAPQGLDLRAAAVTTEPAGGTDLPTGPFALLGAL